MEKTESLLNTFYALRAGLSWISQENDKIKRLKIERLQKTIAVGGKMREYYNELIVGAGNYNPSYVNGKKYWQFFIDIVHKHGNDWIAMLTDIFGEEFKEKDYYQQRTARDGFFDSEFNSEAYAYIDIISQIRMENVVRYGTQAYDKIPDDCNFFRGSKCTQYAMQDYIMTLWLKSGNCEESIKAKLSSLQNRLFAKKKIQKLVQMQAEIPNLLKELNAADNSGNAQIKEKKDDVNVFYEALQLEFSSTLDVRDWRYLDFIIYFFETHRAETVKEALQLVDREMQVQRLEQLIMAATKQICSTLAIGFATIQNTMVNCFNMLSVQIAKSSSQISSQLDSLTNVAIMGNALKSKSNVSSEQLMRDVQQIIN